MNATISTKTPNGGSLHPVVMRQFDGVTLYNADCLDVLPDVVCDAIITDPPYGIGYIKGTGGKGKHDRRNIEPIEGDDQPFDPAPLLAFGSVLMWGADHYAQRLPRGRWLVWDKLDGMESWDSFSDIEVAWHNQTGAARIYRKLWKGVCRPGQENGDARLHPSQKPIALMQWCIEQAKVPEAGTVCDPYMGSGTTAIACIRTGRKFIGVEKDKRHFETACERIRCELAQGVLLPHNRQAHRPARGKPMTFALEIDSGTTAEARAGSVQRFVSGHLRQLWSCGGGRQSCAIAVLIIEGKLPKPDIAVMADTGRERFTTFPYLHKWVIPELAAVGVKLEIVKAEEWSYYGTRYVDGSGDLMLPAYTLENGIAGKNSPDCSGAWKRDSINRWLSKTHGVTRSQFCKWIGFSRSPKELIRAMRMQRSEKEGGAKSRFPLIELRLTTPECLKLVKAHGWPEPKVSACWMCPNLKDSERMELTDEEKRLAIEFDREVRAQFPEAFLHGECRPLEEIELSRNNDLFTEPCETGGCFV